MRERLDRDIRERSGTLIDTAGEKSLRRVSQHGYVSLFLLRVHSTLTTAYAHPGRAAPAPEPQVGERHC